MDKSDVKTMADVEEAVVSRICAAIISRVIIASFLPAGASLTKQMTSLLQLTSGELK